jgi:hypothetical protein
MLSFVLSSVGQEDMNLTCNKIYIKNGVHFYSYNSKLYYKENGLSEKFLESFIPVDKLLMVKYKWVNIHMIKSSVFSLRFEKMCITCNDLEYARKKKNVYFHHRNLDKDMTPKKSTLRKPVFIEKIKLNIPTKQFLSPQDDKFNYDFVSNKDKLYLLIQNNNKIHLYQAADINDIGQNKWEFIKSIDFDFDTEYFTAHHTDENEIKIHFSTQGMVALNIETDKYILTKPKRKQKKKYYLIDVNDGHSTKAISEKKLFRLLK